MARGGVEGWVTNKISAVAHFRMFVALWIKREMRLNAHMHTVTLPSPESDPGMQCPTAQALLGRVYTSGLFSFSFSAPFTHLS
jgi:hypothetical protein